MWFSRECIFRVYENFGFDLYCLGLSVMVCVFYFSIVEGEMFKVIGVELEV